MRFIKSLHNNHTRSLAFFGVAVLVISYFVYFRHYWYPPNLFWDENYHIASAQKYIDGVFFMEPHPPLGKMLIALGEILIRPNTRIDTSSFVSTDYIQNIPAGYSFAGVRFFPALFAMLSSVVFYFILYQLSRRPVLSFLFTSFYLFENAIIVHSRGAMLESIQLFFILLYIWYFLRILTEGRLKKRQYAVLGLLWGLVMAVKLNGISLGFLMAALFAHEVIFSAQGLKTMSRFKLAVSFFTRALVFSLSAFAVVAFVYYLHIALARRVVDGRYYEASGQYKSILANHNSANPVFFPRLLIEHLGFITHYEKGVPTYDACKPGENGSLPVTWPFGDKTINYRWETNDGAARYLYLQGNPAIWFFGLAGIFLALNLIVSRFIFGLPVRNRRLFFLIFTLTGLYMLYMGSVVVLERVMYLYHYFIPLVYSMFLFFLMFLYLFEKPLKENRKGVYLAVFVLVSTVVAAFVFFSPLTYYEPLTRVQFQKREWLPFWGLKPVN